MKKKFKLNEREQEQIDLLKKYYEIDDEKRIIKVILHYASIDEILLCDIESINHPQFDESLFNKIIQKMVVTHDGFVLFILRNDKEIKITI